MQIEVFRGALPVARDFPLPDADYDRVEVVAKKTLASRAQATFARKVLAVAKVAEDGLPLDDQ